MTGAVVIDTSVLVDHLRGKAEATELLLQLKRDGVVLTASVVSKIEILAGVRPAERDMVDRLLSLFQWLPLDEEIAEQAGELASQYRRRHSGIDLADYIVAATCLVLGASLSTLNVKHFPMIPNLQRAY